ncbi:MAG TPA: serine/threonine-protein kinase, partial [Polyangiales bacterium]|nr:serine/threonine-protein kinase [Polyangiales bacterium]
MADATLSSIERRLSRSRVARALLGREPAPVSVGPYHVLGRIGSGGMGVVYEAVHPPTGEHVALKMLRERGFGALQQLQREFRVLSELEHPNLVRLYELSVEGGVPYLSMELVHGERPADFVRAHGAADGERARAVLRQLVDAVGFLHAHGVVHRDLKPSNLLVTAAGRLVVLDFGLARSLAAADNSSASGTPR